jgi:FAD/FMN-containing dehydrogenase
MENLYRIIGQENPRRKRIAPKRAVPKRGFAAAKAALPPLPSIPDARMLTPASADYGSFLALHNRRNDMQPALRIVCASTQAVADSVKWIVANGLSFAVRSGGHCYEGFSQDAQVVIDIRRMGLVTVDKPNRRVAVSGGASLGKVYKKVAEAGFGFAAGSCGTVGVAGHTLGGGYGLLARAFGLACDNLLSVRLVDAAGAIRNCTAAENADLFWAAKGGGGGSFGIATRFEFKVHPLARVRTFRIKWQLADTAAGRAKALNVFKAWQAWAPNAPNAITAILKVQKVGTDSLLLHCLGQSTGSAAALAAEINGKLKVETPTTALSISDKAFIDAVAGFGGAALYNPVFMKAKSDYVFQPLGTAAIGTLFDEILKLGEGRVAALCDPYGGAISSIAANQSAFPYRAPGTYCIQYYSQWTSPSSTKARIDQNRAVYAAMRPFMPGACYVNYCDADLSAAAYPQAYWAGNITRLRQIKAAADPGDVFHHGQSVR